MRIGRIGRAFGLALIVACAGEPKKTSDASALLTLNGALDLLAQSVHQLLAGTSREQNLAVFPLTGQADAESMVGTHLANKLVGRLAGLGTSVVERERCDYLAREIKLSFSELTDPSTAARLGQFLGASAMLTGTVTDMEGWVEVDLRLTDVETARVLGGAEVRIARDEQLKPLIRQENANPSHRAERNASQQRAAATSRLDSELELAFSILAQRQVGKSWEKVEASEGAIVRNGDLIQFHISANMGCHVYILAYQSDGTLFMIFPNASFGHTSSWITPNSDVQIPQRGTPGGEWLTIEPPAGTETFFALATLEEFSNGELTRLIQRMEAAGGGLPVAESSVAVGAMHGVQQKVNEDAAFRQDVAVLSQDLAASQEPATAKAGKVGMRLGTVQTLKRNVGGVSHSRVEEYELNGGKRVEQVVEVIHGTTEAIRKVTLRHEN